MNAPQLSIVIPTCLRPDLLKQCLETVLAHAPQHSHRHAPRRTEVIVVDDASPNSVCSTTAATFPAIRVIRLKRRSGFCAAANAGIRAATAPIIELLNDDTEVTPGWADAALARFANPNIVAVAPLVLQLGSNNSGPPTIDSTGDEYDLGGFARKRGTGQIFDPQHPIYGTSGWVWGVSATAGFYSRAALERTGLFPEHFGAYFEDVDLSHRLQGVGSVWYERSSVVWHRVSASYGRRPNRQVLEQQSCNEERVFWRNLRGRTLVKNLPRHFGVLLGKSARRLAEQRFTPWMLGRLRAWSGR
jgi:GT2 family glycosyltransferase